MADKFITALCNLIQRLAIDSLHILGDVFDRGPSPDKIMNLLCHYHNCDIQWGNHDILWMGAAAGNDSCIANVVRLALRYDNQSVLEDGYGINLLPLATLAIETYGNDDCTIFTPKENEGRNYSSKSIRLATQMHKAITIIQFKTEGAIIKRRPDFEMDDRLLLLAESDEAGVYIVEAMNGRQVFVLGHGEYDSDTLKKEYERDMAKGLNPDVPVHYFRNDDPDDEVLVTWKAHAHLFYTNWVNYYVYQTTPYYLDKI